MKPNELRRLRRSLGLEQTEFAALLDVSQPTIARYETGERHISVTTASRIQKAAENFRQYRETLESVVQAHADISVSDKKIRETALKAVSILNEKISLKELLTIRDARQYVLARLEASVGGIASDRSLAASNLRLQEMFSAV